MERGDSPAGAVDKPMLLKLQESESLPSLQLLSHAYLVVNINLRLVRLLESLPPLQVIPKLGGNNDRTVVSSH
jgi:hypothetical protein